MSVGHDQIDDASDDWHTAANRLRRLYKSLSAGEHKIELQLCYRVCTTDDNLLAKPGEKVFPLHDSPVSAPIARGTFTVKTPGTPPVTLGNMFQVRKTGVNRVKAPQYEKLIQQWLAQSPGWGKRAAKTEEPIHVVLEGDWYVCSTAWFEISGGKLRKEPTQYGIPCVAYFYRSPETGWLKEEIAVFHLTALAGETRNPAQEPPFVHVAVGNHYSFDVDLLPDAVLAKLPRRCPENLREGIF